MELTSIQAHRLGGGAAVVIAALLFLAECGLLRGRWSRMLPGIALLAWGMRSMTHPLPAGADASAAHEGTQHVLIGVAAALVGAIELLRAWQRLRHPLWAQALPAGLLVLGGLFFFHAQHAAAMPMLLTAQHRVIGATLAVAAIVKALAELDRPALRPLRIVFPVVVLLFGIELLLYTEGAMDMHALSFVRSLP